MTEIPAEIMEEARNVAREFAKTFPIMGAFGIVGPVAKAILAAEQRGEQRERERCAKIARTLPGRRYADNVGSVYVEPSGEDIAKAIEGALGHSMGGGL